MRLRDLHQLRFGLGESDVETFFAAIAAFHQKLEREGGLSGSRIALHQMEAIEGESSV